MDDNTRPGTRSIDAYEAYQVAPGAAVQVAYLLSLCRPTATARVCLSRRLAHEEACELAAN